MAVNRRRGEIAATLDGRDYWLCLTLGALAELEDAFGVADLGMLAERFAGGRLSARDIVRVLGAGLRGGGSEISDEEVARLSHADGIAGMAALVAELLAASFGGMEAGESPANP